MELEEPPAAGGALELEFILPVARGQGAGLMAPQEFQEGGALLEQLTAEAILSSELTALPWGDRVIT